MPRPYLSLMLPNLVEEGMPIVCIDGYSRPFPRGWAVNVDPDLDLRERPRIGVFIHCPESLYNDENNWGADFKQYSGASHPCHYALDTSTEIGQRFAAYWYLDHADSSSVEPHWCRVVFDNGWLEGDDLDDLYDDCMALAASMGYVAEAWHDRSAG